MNIRQDSTRNRVKQLMSMDQRFRDSDKHLWLQIAEENGLLLTKAQKFIFMGIPTQEIVARRRREFSKQFPASLKIRQKRYQHEARFVQEFSKQFWLRRMFKKKGVL